MSSVYEVIKGKEAWKSHGAVTFANKDDLSEDTPGEEMRAGYYPCSGVIFRPVVPKPVSYRVKDVYSWAPGDADIQHRTPQPPERTRRTMKFTVENPSESHVAMVRERVRGYGQFAPQARIDEEFRLLFEQLTFTEYSADLLVSNPLHLPKTKLINRQGVQTGTDSKAHSIVFLISHYMAEGEPVMLQRAMWDDGYEALYGCC